MKICIDPGHGGTDPGAVANGLKEKDLTLAISLEVANMLKKYKDIEVILTRDKDITLPLSVARTPYCDISISIHINAGGGQGLETWVSLYNKSGESKKLGELVHKNILQMVSFADRGIRTRKSDNGNYDYLYMLRMAKGIPILVECGFIDNSFDANILKQESNIKKTAQGIVNGIVQYAGLKEDNTKTIIRFENNEIDAVIIDGKTYAEVRKLAELLGYKVFWDAQRKTVEIKR